MTAQIRTGQTAIQYHGKTKIRRVRVLSVNGQVAHVVALNGPMAGAEYDIDIETLKGQR